MVGIDSGVADRDDHAGTARRRVPCGGALDRLVVPLGAVTRVVRGGVVDREEEVGFREVDLGEAEERFDRVLFVTGVIQGHQMDADGLDHGARATLYPLEDLPLEVLRHPLLEFDQDASGRERLTRVAAQVLCERCGGKDRRGEDRDRDQGKNAVHIHRGSFSRFGGEPQGPFMREGRAGGPSCHEWSSAEAGVSKETPMAGIVRDGGGRGERCACPRSAG